MKKKPIIIASSCSGTFVFTKLSFVTSGMLGRETGSLSGEEKGRDRSWPPNLQVVLI